MMKVRLQTGNRQHLWRGLYNGVGSRMAGVIPDWVACYCGYTIGKRMEYPKWVPSSVHSFGAGCFAGFLGGVILCPFDAVKMLVESFIRCIVARTPTDCVCWFALPHPPKPIFSSNLKSSPKRKSWHIGCSTSPRF